MTTSALIIIAVVIVAWWFLFTTREGEKIVNRTRGGSVFHRAGKRGTLHTCPKCGNVGKFPDPTPGVSGTCAKCGFVGVLQ